MNHPQSPPNARVVNASRTETMLGCRIRDHFSIAANAVWDVKRKSAKRSQSRDGRNSMINTHSPPVGARKEVHLSS